jgi:hypothetical protein
MISYFTTITRISGLSYSVDLATQNRALVNYFGPSGWARCVAGQITISALAARGDKINPEIIKTNDSVGTILGGMRQYMLANGVQQSQLDALMKAQASQKQGELWP